MVQELEQKNSSEGFNGQVEESITTIARKFDFDYPILSTENFVILTSALEKGWEGLPLRLNAKFAENLNYMAQSKSLSEDKAFAKAMSSFTICMFLSQPEKLLQMNRAALSAIFKKRDLNIEMNEEVIFSSMTDSSTTILLWDEIFEEFFSFLLRGSASLICGMVPDDTTWCAANITSGKHLDKLCQSLSLFGKLLSLAFVSKEESPANTSKEATLHEALTARVMRDSNDDKALISSLQKVWLHLAFLARDILVQCPSLVEPSLGTVLTSVACLSTNIDDAFQGSAGSTSSYPSSKECLQALICANIAAALSGPPPSGKGAETAATAKAREAFRRITSGDGQRSGNVTLLGLVDTLERMGRQASDGGAEACSLLLDICNLYLDDRDTRGIAFKRASEAETMYQSLLSSRAVPVLVDLFARFMGAEGPSHHRKTPIVAQLVTFFSQATLQGSGNIGSFLVRLPLFLPSVRAVTKTWNEENEIVAVSPAETIPLFLALCIALSLDKPLEPSHELVLALKGSVSLTLARLQAAGQVKVSEHPEISDSALEDEVEKQEVELKHDVQMKAKHVPGLSSALRLLLSPDATGHAAVGRVKDLPDLHEAMVQLSEAIESFSSRSDEVRRLGKELKAAVEGVSGSKTD